MSEINVLKGRKFEDCWGVYARAGSSVNEFHGVILERLGQLSLGGVNPNSILSLSGLSLPEENGADWVGNLRADLIERCDLITRTLFNQSLFESTQADIEAEEALRDAENEYSRATEAAQAAFAKYRELHEAYQTKVEEVTQ